MSVNQNMQLEIKEVWLNLNIYMADAQRDFWSFRKVVECTGPVRQKNLHGQRFSYFATFLKCSHGAGITGHSGGKHTVDKQH